MNKNRVIPACPRQAGTNRHPLIQGISSFIQRFPLKFGSNLKQKQMDLRRDRRKQGYST